MQIVGKTALALLMAAILSGCGKDDAANFNIDYNVLDFCQKRDLEKESKDEKSISEMAPGDVIVSINGVVLTKAGYDNLMLIRAQALMDQKGMSNIVLSQLMDEYRKSYIRKFIGQRLIVDEAFRTGAVTTNEVQKHVVTSVRKNIRNSKLPVKKFLARYRGSDRVVFYEMGVAYIMNKFITKNVKPTAKVTDELVELFQKEIQTENKNAVLSNNLIRAEMKNVREQIVSGKLKFEDAKGCDGDGYWGEFESGDFPSKEFENAVFALREGQISDVLEDDDGFHIVKFLSKVAPMVDQSGSPLESEKIKLAHIYREKSPLLLTQGNLELSMDMERQFKTQALNEYIFGLMTNGNHKVIFPHGNNLFTKEN